MNFFIYIMMILVPLCINGAPRVDVPLSLYVPVKNDLFITGDLIVGGNITFEGTIINNGTGGSFAPIDANGNVTLNGITKNGITVSWPSTAGALGTVLTSDGMGNLVYSVPLGSGNVSTALFFTNNDAFVVTDFASGATNIKATTLFLSPGNNITGVNTLTASLVNANLNGNATTATTAINANNAINAVNFSGTLNGDVTGTQPSTVVSAVGGQTASVIAAGAVLANNATSSNVLNSLVKRDGITGGFTAGTITANVVGNVTGNLTGNATFATSAGSFSGNLAGDVTGPQSATAVAFVGGQSATNVSTATIASNNATATNTVNAIVKRDGAGNFSAGTITANLTGNVTGNATTATTATTATNATNVTGNFVGDVTGTQSAMVVSFVGGQSAASVATGVNAANNANSANNPGAIVKRDGSGNFVTGTMTGNVVGNVTGNLSGNATTATTATNATNATNFTNPLAGDVTGTQTATVVALVGGQTATAVANATTTVTNATNNNTINTLVKRDGSGNFASNVITVNGVTINGVVVNPTDAATKQYVDAAVSTGFSVHPSVVLAETVNNIVSLNGNQTLDGVLTSNGNRVLLNAQTITTQNGLWVVNSSGAWTRPVDFANGTTAGSTYVLVTAGTTNAGSSWVCATPLAVIGTNAISFGLFSVPDQTTAANVGAGAGEVFRDKTGNTLNLKTVAAGTHMVVTNNANDITLSTDATNANTVNTIVSRDASGNFVAGTITASLTGAASNNVLKAGDTMTGTLNMATQSEVRLQDQVGGQYVGMRAPTTVGTSYTVDMPASAPTAGQFLQAATSSGLQWATIGGSPALTRTYYVSLNGSDSNDGSFSLPFRTVKYAVSVANGVSSLASPVVIAIGSGAFVEDNSGGPITITGNGIILVGSSMLSTAIVPNTLGNDLLHINSAGVALQDLTLLVSSGTSTATGVVVTAPVSRGIRFIDMVVSQFQTGFNLTGVSAAPFAPLIVLENVQCGGNGTSVVINNNVRCVIQDSLFQGPFNPPTVVNTGLTVSGSATNVICIGDLFTLFNTAISVTNGASVRVLSTSIESTNNGVVAGGACEVQITGSSFYLNNAGSINVAVSDANTIVEVEACQFQCFDASNTPRGTAVQVIDAGECDLNACEIEGAVLGLKCGLLTDTSTTKLHATGVVLTDCTSDIQQLGTATLNFVGGVFDHTLVSIANTTNVNFAAFDNNAQYALTLGSGSDTVEAELYQVYNGQPFLPHFHYTPTFYGSKGVFYQNQNSDATFNATIANGNNASYVVVSGDRTKQAALQLISDTGAIGVSDNVRGWMLAKLATSANLAFMYSNNDTVGQATIDQYTPMSIDGAANQINFPLVATVNQPTNTVAKLVWAGDTTLYRSAANTLKTDGNMVVGGITSNRAVASSGTSQLVASATTDTELGYLSGVTSSVQTQLNSKVAKSGDTMTGTLTLPAGVAGTPELNFTGSLTTGIGTSAVDQLSFDTAGVERMKISSTGVVTINGLTSAGVVHNSSLGALSSSLIVNADVDPAAAIVDTKLATIATPLKVANSATTATSTNINNAIVARDGSGNFTAGTITANLSGIASNATNATTAINFTGALSGDVTGVQSATVVSNVGGQTATAVAQAASAVANATSANTAGTLVLRDGASNFSANVVTVNRVTINGVVTNPTDGATKSYVDTAVSTGFTVHTPVVLAETVGTVSPLSGNTTLDGVPTVNGNRVLLNAQLNPVENGLWVVNSGGPWTRPVDFATGTVAGSTYVLVTSGLTNSGSSWVCSTPSAIIDTNPILFSQFSVPNQTTAANVGLGSGQIFRDTVSNTINLRTLSSGPYMSIVTDNTNSVVIIGTNATSGLTPSTIVARDASNNFSAGTITANLAGNATTATTAINFTGSLSGDVNGTQGATVVNTVGGVSAANVASGAQAANAATNVNTINTIVKRDLSGNFSAGTITAALNGNATTATSAGSFSGTLAGDVTGTQSATVVATVGGVTAANVASGANAANGATSLNTPSTIVARDASGNFSAGTITANLTGNVTGSASLNVLKAGDTMTGTLTHPVGTAAVPSIQFTGSTNTGLSAATANQLSFDTNGVECMNISPTGTVTINGLTSAGVVHNSAAGALSTSLIVNADVDPAAAIVDTKLATISTAGKVANSATTATSANTASAIVARDASGNFSAGTITANLTGNVTGSASLNVLKAGDTMTGTLTHPAGTAAVPSIQFTGSTNTGLSAATANQLSFDTNGAERMNISPTGTVTINGLTSAGVVHNSAAGALSTSLIVNADVDPAAAIVDTKLATISTAGKVANSATTATSANTASAIVARDASGNFSAGTITANLTGNVTGSASLNVLKAGDTMTGTLTHPAGTAAVPSIQFTGSTNTGLSAATANQLSFDTNGAERMNISPTGTVTINGLTAVGVVHNSAAGALSTSLIVNADVSATAAIVDTKLATISTAGKVANSATTATSANTASAIVARDASGNFAAGTITASLTGLASLNVPLAGGTMTGTLTHPAGTAAAPSIQFTGSTNTGLSAATANQLSFDTNGAERMNISPTGTVTINGLTSAGVVHNSAAGALSTSLIVNADVSATAAIVDTKLATISTAGKVANSATTATSANTASAIVARDASGNFSAGTITASLTGLASLNLPLTGGTLTGTLIHPGNAAPTINFTGSGTNTGLASSGGSLSMQTNGFERIYIFSTGVVGINGFTSAGVVHNNAVGALSTSLIVDADVSATAAIADTKLATISTAGKIANSATTATSVNTANLMVARDASGNFSANTITANLTGLASLNLPLAGGTLTGTLTCSAGSSSSPSIQFTGSTNTGLSAATANQMVLSANGTLVATIMATAFQANSGFALKRFQNVFLNSGATVFVNVLTNDFLVVLSWTGLASPTANINLPFPGIDGQIVTFVANRVGSVVPLLLTYTGTPPINAVTSMDPNNNIASTSAANSVSYIYQASASRWLVYARG